jgi:hypothetical protein
MPNRHTAFSARKELCWILLAISQFPKRARVPKLGRGTDYFTSLPKEGMLWIFSTRKIRSGANPRSWVPEASMLTTSPPKPLTQCNHNLEWHAVLVTNPSDKDYCYREMNDVLYSSVSLARIRETSFAFMLLLLLRLFGPFPATASPSSSSNFEKILSQFHED